MKPLLRRAATLCLLVCALFATANGTTGHGPARRCGKCKDEGVLPCGKHKKASAAGERTAAFCSDIRDCGECGGTGWGDCKKCGNAEAEEWLHAEVAQARDLRKELSWIEREWGAPLRVAASEHFVLVWQIEKHRAARKKRGGHELVHLYLERLEALFDEYVSVLEAKREDFAKRQVIFVWETEEDQKRASELFCDVESETAVKRLGAEGRVSLMGLKPWYEDDDALHRGLAHEVAHLLSAAQKPTSWVGDKQGGWLDAGWAHWFEDHVFGMCENVCYTAYFYREQIDKEAWRANVRRMVTKDDVPDMATVLFQNTETMPIEFHAVAFSLVDFLVSKGGKDFNDFYKLVRRRTPARDALFDVYQLSIDDFEQEWRSWVRASY